LKVAALQSNYIPWKGNFDLINAVDKFIFYDEVQYTKNDWRNRNRIYSKNGLQWLTIPIYKDAVKQKVSEVMLNDQSWQEKHFKTLNLTYKSAPFFHQLESLLINIYRENQWQRLIDLNRYILKKLSGIIGIQTTFLDSNDYELKGDKVDKLLGLLMQVGATEYISGPSGKDYLNSSKPLFEAQNIKLTYMDYSNYPTYEQLQQEFVHEVSLLDTIANVDINDIHKYTCTA